MRARHGLPRTSSILQHEVKVGRLPPELLPLQSGVGNIANAVLAGLNNGPFDHLNAYRGAAGRHAGHAGVGQARYRIDHLAGAEPGGHGRFLANIDYYRQRIMLRPQEISNHPELIRRMGLISIER
jgi:succinyl-CoA:acetate CoA-transferase